MSQLPAWVQFFNALSPSAIAAAVGYVAYRQWRTAHQRVVLDLFERRIAIVDALLRAVSEIRQQTPTAIEASDVFWKQTKGAEFLFRRDVMEYLEHIHRVIVDLWAKDEEYKDAEDDQRSELIAERRRLRNELDDFFVRFRRLVAPYVQMHQKL